jgi:hypothetical protein
MTGFLWSEALFSWRRLAGRRGAAIVLSALLATVLLAALERRAAAAFALDRALLGATFGMVLPLACFALARCLIPTRPEDAVGALAQFGVSRRTALAGRVLVLFTSQAALGLLLGLVTVVVAGPTMAWSRELLSIVWIAPLGALAFGAVLLLGASFGPKGAVVALLLDWVFGNGTGAFALPWPRAHIRSLLGGMPVLELVQLQSGLLLWAIVVFGALGALSRTPR